MHTPTLGWRKQFMGWGMGIVVGCGMAGSTFAQEPVPPVISGSAGVTFVSHYISRGVILENEGLIVQPWLGLNTKLFEAETKDSFIRKISAFIDLWSSVHSSEAQAPPTTTTEHLV